MGTPSSTLGNNQTPEAAVLPGPSKELALSSSRPRSNQGAVAAAEPSPERPLVPSSAADWEARKHIIKDLYMDKNLILNHVIEIMIARHSFKATYVDFFPRESDRRAA